MIACGMAVLLESRGPAIKLKLFDEWFKAFKLCDLANLIGVPAIKFIELQELIIFFIQKKRKVSPEHLKSYLKAIDYKESINKFLEPKSNKMSKIESQMIDKIDRKLSKIEIQMIDKISKIDRELKEECSASKMEEGKSVIKKVRKLHSQKNKKKKK
eukprot:GHVL01036186.1.p1 GENE.GHVL01036186.1~~GHVL01036186.1.p1  ORF type:complete len:157 (-),score=40.89 GHVL01036186.1:25-495(-)